ncbi:MAG TPA: hypothetical protein VIV06_06700, partial [Candidatus Limnocylindrales bacterium]
MTLDDRFDDLAAGLGGFHQTWIAYLGIELGLVARLREAGPGGLSAAELAAACGCQLDPIYAWSRAAHAAGLVAIDGDRVIVDPDVARILLDDKRPEYLGGQFVSTIVSSLDYEGLADFVR